MADCSFAVKKHDFIIWNNMVDGRVVAWQMPHHSIIHLTRKVFKCKHMK